MGRIVHAVVLLACAQSLFAQGVPPALMVKVKERSEPLTVSRVNVDVRTLGYLAQTTMTLTFSNPHPRQLAGDLYFPLPEGSTVSGYALDINGVMVDGVVVGKQKGRVVFEKVVRQGIDPGLVEWVKGNNFKTRVFPIPARGSRTVRVSYVADLVQKDGNAQYVLPLRFRGTVRDFALRLEVVKAAMKPLIVQGGPAGLEFTKWQDSYVAETKLTHAALDRDLVVSLPDVDKQKVLVEKCPDGEYYFAVHDFPSDPRSARERVAPAPKRVTVLWDGSGSRGKGDHGRELQLLKAYFARLRDHEVAVDAIVFRHRAEKPRQFVIRNGDADALIAQLGTVQYDGGTQIGSLSPQAGATQPDLYLLFTDGLSNFGKEEPSGFAAPVYILSADAAANHPFLRYLAMQTGGEYFNLARLGDDAVLPNIGSASYTFISATPKAGAAVGLYPTIPQPVHGRFTVVGKLGAKEAEVSLNYGTGGKVLRSETYTISRADAAEGSLLRLFWAQRKVQELQVFPERNAKDIVATGKAYGLVTPGTSLIVLESLAQYLEHEIQPPESLPEMRREYEIALAERRAKEKHEERSKLDYVVGLWEARVKWWATEFKYPQGFKYAETVKGKQERRAQGLTLAAPAAAPAALARAVRPQADREEARDDGMAKEPSQPSSAEPAIAIKPWDPKTPYVAALKQAEPQNRVAAYMQQRRTYGGSPAFFLDCADFLYRQKQDGLALQVLSNIAELELENAALIRVLAHKLAQVGELELSALLFEQVLRLRPEEPQSYRDLALVLAQMGKYERAIELLYHVVMNRWDRFQEIEVIALTELNAIIPAAKRAGVEKIAVDPRLIKLLDVDVRIVMTWDADLTDIDLWVTEPSAEKAFYGHKRTTIGGNVSRDFTQGYGPEEYMLRRAMVGEYKIQANYYGSRTAALFGPATLQVDVFTNYGRPNEKRQSITLRLEQKKEVVEVGVIEF